VKSRPPRLALVYDRIYPLLNGGGERRYYELGRRLAHEFDVRFFYYGQGADPAAYPGSVAQGVGGHVPMYTPRGRRSIRESADFARRLLRPLSAFKPDLIDCSSVSYASVPICAVAARRVHAALVITWHEYWGPYWSQYLPSGVATVARLFERSLPRLAAANVAVSTFTATRLQQGSGAAALVVPNGIDMELISAATPSATQTDIVFVGRLIKDKRVPLLLDAVREIASRMPELHIEIIGDGPERDLVRDLVRLLPGNVHVNLVSRVADERELYGRIKSARVFVLPSDREGYGLVVAEAQACGTVPVVVRGPDNAAVDLITQGETGVITEPNADELAGAIETLLRDSDLRMRIGQRALDISAVRDWDYSAAATSALFHTLLRNQSKHASYDSNAMIVGV
jgi:glycosyltransferase involved in cell wall biosynthesis